jgi:2-iminobutanoate/2-iminopropanoate deaminase
MSTVISTKKAPAAVGPYSQAIQAGEVSDIIFTSGQLGLIPETGEFPEGGVEAQARQSLENIKAILSEAGFAMSQVVKTTVLLQDIGDFAAVNAIYAEYFAEGALPARSAFQVAALPKGGLVEIEAIAAR